MTGFSDALRGYAFPIHQRDNFKCRYYGVQGSQDFNSWLTLSWDHFLPKGHPNRDNPEFIITACNFCNSADNHYFELAERRGLKFDGLTPDQLVDQRLPYVQATHEAYKSFWKQHVSKE